MVRYCSGRLYVCVNHDKRARLRKKKIRAISIPQDCRKKIHVKLIVQNRLAF